MLLLLDEKPVVAAALSPPTAFLVGAGGYFCSGTAAAPTHRVSCLACVGIIILSILVSSAAVIWRAYDTLRLAHGAYLRTSLHDGQTDASMRARARAAAGVRSGPSLAARSRLLPMAVR